MPKRKRITMLVTVSVPAEMTAAEARREVRSLVNEMTTWAADFDEIVAVSVKALPKR